MKRYQWMWSTGIILSACSRHNHFLHCGVMTLKVCGFKRLVIDMGVRECKCGLHSVFFFCVSFCWVQKVRNQALIAKLLIQRCCDGFLFQYLDSLTRKSQRHQLVIHSSEAAVSIFLHRCLWLHFFFFAPQQRRWLWQHDYYLFFFNGGKKKKS